MSRFRAAVVACALPFLAASSVTAQSTHYHVAKRINLGRARADYIIVDPVGRRLYGLGDNVIDVDKG